jgi:hypothetical protein
MNRIVKINFTHGPLATGFIHINGNELTQYESWYIPEEV